MPKKMAARELRWPPHMAKNWAAEAYSTVPILEEEPALTGPQAGHLSQGKKPVLEELARLFTLSQNGYGDLLPPR